MMTNTILAAILVIVVVTLILVALLLFIKIKLTPSGTVMFLSEAQFRKGEK